MARTPFQIAVPDSVLEDLRRRLENTRWPDSVERAQWDYGTNLAYLQELTEYWRTKFDWRAQERELNRFAQFRSDVDGFGLHFIYERGKGPAPMPILLSHGWPDSIARMVKLIPRLTDPAAHGGDAADAFDVIVPSVPGFGFSDRPSTRGFGISRIATLFAKLMHDELGYARYAAHGGDWGSGITERLASQTPEQLAGIHLTDIPYWRLFATPAQDQSPPEQKFMQAGRQWSRTEGAYAMIQGTKPQTLAFGLNDSPVGLASWIIEKFRSWSDCGGDIERRFSKDELLTNITIYWATQTIHSSCRTYYESLRDQPQSAKRIEVPTGVAMFPKDLVSAPREYGERYFNIQRWQEMPRGGHFAALEEPDLLAKELREFYRPLR
jgi:pimeloyl-ACP methyl ester carboxylesterase